MSNKTGEQRARRIARQAGYVARKSKSRNPFYRGGFMLIDPRTNFPVAGFDYSLSAQGVIDFCK
jgi:hypothetical protein